MEIVGVIFEKTLEIFCIELDIYGYTFSYWEVLVFTVVSSLVCAVIVALLSGR